MRAPPLHLRLRENSAVASREAEASAGIPAGAAPTTQAYGRSDLPCREDGRGVRARVGCDGGSPPGEEAVFLYKRVGLLCPIQNSSAPAVIGAAVLAGSVFCHSVVKHIVGGM